MYVIVHLRVCALVRCCVYVVCVHRCTVYEHVLVRACACVCMCVQYMYLVVPASLSLHWNQVDLQNRHKR